MCHLIVGSRDKELGFITIIASLVLDVIVGGVVGSRIVGILADFADEDVGN
ncbi:MAG: hypothetical protein N2C12_00895 [Planctomycetales bacterium]